MEKPCEEAGTLPEGVFQLPREPAIVIKGVPPPPPADNTLISCEITSQTEKQRKQGFGEWLVGREVRKLFGDKSYSGKVTEFDKTSGWYRVVYEDGDFEDLEWHELADILLPLDITMPLRTLAMKVVRMKQKPNHGTRSGTGGKRGRLRKEKAAAESATVEAEVTKEDGEVKCGTNAVVIE